ncbi:hypothetical protein HN51_017130 [Arachis hypogaea]
MAIDDRHCSSNGCCELDIPTGMRMVAIQVATYFYCGYSFVVKNGYYSFSKARVENLPYQMFLVVFDWNVGNKTCKESLSRGTNACMLISRDGHVISYYSKWRSRGVYLAKRLMLKFLLTSEDRDGHVISYYSKWRASGV